MIDLGLSGGPAVPCPTVAPVQLIGPHSLLQSTLPGESGFWRAVARAPQLDAVVRRPLANGVALDHFHRAQGRPDRNWVQGASLTLASTAPAALAQRRGRPTRHGWRHGDLVVLSPEADGLVRHVRSFTPGGLAEPWRRVDVGAPADAVALVARGDDLHALVVDADGLHHVDPLGRRTTLTADHGSPALAVADRWLVAALGTPEGTHAWRLADDGWRWLGVVAPPGQPALVASGSDVRLALTGAEGVRLFTGTPHRHGPWAPAGHLADAATHGVALAASRLGDGLDLSRVGLGEVGHLRGWVQALVQEGESVYQWHHQRADGRWARAACLRFVDPEPVVVDERPSIKLAQVSGERDSQPWVDGPRGTLSASGSTSGVRGTDLGVRVDHAGRSYLLCGDTHWTRRRWATRDAIAAIEPGEVPRFTFHGAPVHVVGASMTEYDVPLDAFSLGSDWYLFATSNHFARHQVMGRSVLARALDDPAAISPTSRRPLRFRTVATVSDWRFVNVSCQWVATPPGLSTDSAEVLALWGSGSYRADDLRLAVLDAHRSLTQLSFFAGLDADGGPRWSDAEADATPIVAGAFGEVSVRWVPELARFVLLDMTAPGDAAGGAVVMRTSPTPWGPWSPRRVLLDWIRDGLSFADPSLRWIKAHVADDPVGDAIFRGQATATGGAYAPYLFDARRDGDDVVLRYTLSTWNPYQIVLMEHRLPGTEGAASR